MPNFTLNDQVFFDAASQFQTPFHLYTEEGIRQTARGLIKAFSGVPVFREYFAVKALPNPTVLRILKEEGCGLDCASQTELMLAEALGFRGDDIILSANDVPPAEFAYARSLGATINLDDISHVEILKNNGGIPEEICLRFNPGGDFRIGTQIMGNPGEAKYGMTRAQLTEALLKLKGDGSGTLTYRGVTRKFTWDADDLITDDGEIQALPWMELLYFNVGYRMLNARTEPGIQVKLEEEQTILYLRRIP